MGKPRRAIVRGSGNATGNGRAGAATKRSSTRASRAGGLRPAGMSQALRSLMRASPLAIIAVGLDGRIRSWNPAAERLFGWAEEEVLGQPVPILPAGKSAEFRSLLADTRRGKAAVNRELRRRRKDGSLVDVAIWTAPWHDLRGRLTGSIAIFADITERRRIEDAARAEQEFRKAIENSVAAGIVAVDTVGRHTYVNAAFCKMVGWGRQELLGARTPPPYWPPEERARLLAVTTRILMGKAHPSGPREVRFWRRNRRRFDALVSVAPIKDSSGKLTGWVTAVSDITRLKQAEAKARAQEEFRKALESAQTSGTLVCDLSGRITYINRAFTQLLGWTRRQLVGRMPPYPFWPPEDRQPMEALARTILAGKAPTTGMELRLLRRDGQRLDMMLHISPLRDELGHVAGWVGSLHDITEQKHRERALRESQERYRSLVESQYDLIVRVDMEGRFTFINDVYCAVAGRRREELLGKPFIPMVHPDDLPKTLDAMKPLYGPPHRMSVEQRMKAHDGYRWIAWEDAAILDEKGQIVEIQAIGRDITQRKQDEERIRAYQQQLRSMGSELTLAEERERRRIATDLHDDIAQSLALGQLKVEALRQACGRCPDGRLDEIHALLDRTIQATRSLTYQLSPPILYDLGLVAALEWLCEQMRKQYGLGTRFEHRDAQPAEAGGVPEPLRIVFFRAARELLINVTKHARVNQAELALTSRDGQLVLAVSDKGVGSLFCEGTSPLPAATDHGGFGLFSIRERLEHLGGSMRIQSAPGRGTRVVLSAPLQETVKPPQREGR